MSNLHKNGQIVFTHKARCRDCYRCIRVCPVKAIRMQDDQAFVVEERCIACGTCIRECPREAKAFRNDVDFAKSILAEHDSVAVSLAPSFAAVWTGWKEKRIISALRKLGFSYVSETSIGAYTVARKTGEQINENDTTHITTACPAVINYIEKYQPQFIDNMTPVVSPMIAHARHLKKSRGKATPVIFIGPCVAKKSEAERAGYKKDIDCVITFEELQQWLDEEGIRLDQLEESDFDERATRDARLFPLVGGLAKTAALPTDALNTRVLAISGVEDLDKALQTIDGHAPPLVIEPLFCQHGCINGPAIACEDNLYNRRKNVLNFADNGEEGQDPETDLDLAAAFSPQLNDERTDITEDDIRRVLAETGQAKPEDELNCMACGYPSCRDRAVAVLQGMAEPEMCIPHMRRLAEQRSDRIMETSPNGIVILDTRLRIINMNPAFRKMFMCSEGVRGKPISYILDPAPFEKLTETDEKIEMTVEHEKYNLVTHQILYKLEEEEQLVGIFVNITQRRESIKKLEKLRQETVLQAQELMEHQIAMAQNIAKFMGESTARGEVLVDNLMKLTRDEPKADDEKKSSLWDIYTSK